MKRWLLLLLFSGLAQSQVSPVIPTGTVLGNTSGSTAAPSALTLTQIQLIPMVTPASPTVTPTTGGTLAAGTYQITVVDLDASGGLSLYPAAQNCVVDGSTTTACAITGLAASPGAVSQRVYVGVNTTPNTYAFVAGGQLAYTLLSTASVLTAPLPTSNTAYARRIDGSSGYSWIPGAQVLDSAYLLVNNNPVTGAVAAANFFFGNDAPYAITVGAGDMGIGLHALQFLTSGNNNLAIGWDSQYANISGSNDVSVGEDALKFVTGSSNTAVGYTAAYTLAGGGSNTVLGSAALYSDVSGNNNTAIGAFALNSELSAGSTAVGLDALKNITGGSNTAVGFQAGRMTGAQTYSGAVMLGYQAGYYSTASNVLIIDNAPRASEAAEKTNAMMYGTFATTIAAQTLFLNAQVTVAGLLAASTQRAVNIGTTADTIAASIASTYESANTASGAFTVTFAAPTGDGERRRVCFKNLTGTITWAVTAPATATAGLPTTMSAGQCLEVVYNSAVGVPANSPATTWVLY